MGASQGDPLYATNETMTVPGGIVIRIGKVEKRKELLGYVDCAGLGDGEAPHHIPKGFRYRARIDGEIVLGADSGPVATTIGNTNYSNAICRFDDGEKWEGNAWQTSVLMTGNFLTSSRVKCVVFVLYDKKPTITGQLG